MPGFFRNHGRPVYAVHSGNDRGAPMTQSDNAPWIIVFYTPIIIWIASIHGVARAVILALTHDADSVSNTAVLLELCPRWVLVGMLVVFACTAALACAGRVRSLVGMMLCLWPQQALQTVAAMGALQAIWLSAYADGLERSTLYIVQDQMPFVWLVIGHGLAIWQLMRTMRRH